MANINVETFLSYLSLTEPLIPNPVTDVDKLVNDLRRRYRTYVVEFDVEHGAVHLPNMFMHDFGDQINFIATLVDSEHNQFEVYVEKHTSGIYLTRGWRALRDFYQLSLGAWVTMVFVGNGRFEISLEDRVRGKIPAPIFTPPVNFVIDRSWLPFQMMDAVPTAYVHSDMSFAYSYQKKLSANEIMSGWMVLAHFGFCKMTLCRGTTSINLVDECGNKWMCTVVYGTKPYKHFKIGGGWKRMVDARGLKRGCNVMLGAPTDGMNQTFYFRVIRY